MRKVLVESLLKHIDDPRFVFVTADLGFNMLEPLQAALGDRFINCGIAEQNMISMCAGLAKSGMRPWCYSIAPFIYARAFEQIRNDICFHNLPVVMIGNGGGYAYGINGPTHHALEDYGILLCLPNIRCYVPAFDAQINTMVNNLLEINHPAYLRLGIEEYKMPYGLHGSFRRMMDGNNCTILCIGPIAGSIINACDSIASDASRPSLWVASELPLGNVPDAFIDDVNDSGHLIIIEEHVEHGGLATCLFHDPDFRYNVSFDHIDIAHVYADSPPYPSYGSQAFHRKQSGLDIDSIMGLISAYNGK